MTEIISVRFKEGGKAYYFNPNGIQVADGEKVVIETSRGIELGTCCEGNRMIDERELVAPLRQVVRLATKEDFATAEENHRREAKAFETCQQKIAEHGLDMKLVEVEYSFDGSKILFFFTSDGRVDFRALVRDLASVFHTRIELRQIGVRDEAKLLGGLGICGRPYCCNAFLGDFHPVSIKMAKTQNLSLNPTKISGACGRLMCCLKYEQEAYEDVLSRTPRLESLVETPDGVGVINSVQLLREKVRVKLDDDPENPKVYSSSEITVIRSGKGKRPEGYELPEPTEKEPAVRLRPVAPTPAPTIVQTKLASRSQKHTPAPRPAEKPAVTAPQKPAKPEPRVKPEAEQEQRRHTPKKEPAAEQKADASRQEQNREQGKSNRPSGRNHRKIHGHREQTGEKSPVRQSEPPAEKPADKEEKQEHPRSNRNRKPYYFRRKNKGGGKGGAE